MKFIQTSILLSVFLFCNSCSIVISSFLINKSDRDKIIEIQLDNSSYDSLDSEEIVLNYTNSIEKINYSTYKKLDKKLEYQIIDNQVLKFKLPKNSTLQLFNSRNHFPQINSIKIDDKKFDLEIMQDDFKKGWGSNYYYEIK